MTVCKNGSEGLYFFTAIKTGKQGPDFRPYHFIFDKKGWPVYYYQLKKGHTTADFKILPNKQISYFDTDKFYLMDSTFSITDSITWQNGVLKDAHDLQLTPDGHYLILGLKEVKRDLSKHKIFKKNQFPGDINATVKIGVVQEYDKSKKLIFEWNSEAYFKLEDIDTLYINEPNKADIPHLNSVELDTDGNLILSCRNYNEIIKISRENGKVIWRFGGKNNQFWFLNDTTRFYGQHSVRRLSNGNLLFYDNGSCNPLHPSCAREYTLDENKMTAKLVWSYTNNIKSYSSGNGNARRLINGNTLINYGRSNTDNIMFDVVTPKGEKVFEIAFKDSLRAYRAFNYFELPFQINRPKITCIKQKEHWALEVGEEFKEYRWSNGQTSKAIDITEAGVYYVSVPTASGGWICSQPVHFDETLNPVPLK